MKLVFSDVAWEEYLAWQASDRAVSQRINRLIREIELAPFEGSGKPERLRHALAGYWSRRITADERIVYKVEDDVMSVATLRYHF